MGAARVSRKSAFTGLGAALFAAAVVLLFLSLFQGAPTPLVIAALLFAATIACWICAARYAEKERR